MNKIKIISLFIFCIFLFTIIVQAKTFQTSSNSDKFFLWAVSDTHGAYNWDDDVNYNGNSWSGNLISEGVTRIDYGFIAGDILLSGGYPHQYANYVNDTCSCILPNQDMSSFWSKPADERIWGFCIGNHEEYFGGCSDAAKGIGLDSNRNWYNNEVVMGHCYNYTVLRGNLLFIYMGGSRDSPHDYTYNIPTADDFIWLENQVSWADENNVNVLIITHSPIFNSTNTWGFLGGYSNHDVYYDVQSKTWKTCQEHTNPSCDFDDPWPGDNYWTECDDYWDLINSYKNVNLWFNGHIHIAADDRSPPPHDHEGWDSTFGVERDVQKSKDCTFVHCCGVYQWGMPFSYSRVLIFSENDKDVKIKSFDHMSHSYGHDTGASSSHQDITITDCLKYPYNPDFQPPVKLTADAGGPYQANIDEEISISGSAIGGTPSYNFFWDLDNDGEYDDKNTQTFSYSWGQEGKYLIKLKVIDSLNNIAYDETSISIGNNPPDKPDRPTGVTSGNTGVNYRYSSKTQDFEGEQIYYCFDWGDGSNSGWLGPYDSGQICNAYHSWSEKGTYIIKVKAKDINEAESDWSEPLGVVMPKYRIFQKYNLQKIFSRFMFLRNIL